MFQEKKRNEGDLKKKIRQLLDCHWRETGSRDEGWSWRANWSVSPFISFYYYCTLPCQASFPISILPKKEACLSLASPKLPKAFLISLVRTSWAGSRPLSCLPLWGGAENRKGDGQVTYLPVGVGSALPKLASQREFEALLSVSGRRVWLTVAVWSGCCGGAGKRGRNSIVVNLPFGTQREGRRRWQKYNKWQQIVDNPQSTYISIYWSHGTGLT